MDCLAVARLIIRKEAPYFSSVVYGLIPMFVPGIGTLFVTAGFVLGVDPEWFVNMEELVPDVDEQGNKRSKKDIKKYADRMRAAVVVHEVMHILRKMSRIAALLKRGADPDTVNKAFDIPINDDLKEANWPLPHWVVYSTTYRFPKGLTGEQYYELLVKKAESSCAQGGSKKGKGKDGEGKGQGAGGGQDEPKVGSGKCGGCAGNPVRKELEDALDKQAGRTAGDQQRIRRQAARDMRKAAAEGRGTLPQKFVEVLDDNETKSVIPWRSRLRRIVRNATGRIMAGQADFSMRRPSKRSFVRGILRPSMIDRKVEVAFVEDSSGSMGADQLQHARAEACGVFQQLGLHEAWFLDADAKVAAAPKRVHMRELKKLPVHGRGGTNFIPAIELVQTLVPKPDICIYLTDGDGKAPEKAPKGMETVWCIVPTPYGRRPAKWGHLVVVSDDQSLRDPYGL